MRVRETLENQQVKIYFGAVLLAAMVGYAFPSAVALDSAINPAIALMLFVTFLQVPMAELGRAFLKARFFGALLLTNFVAIPILVYGLIQFLPDDPMIRLGVLLVLLTPCIDYVVTFTHLGRGDAKLLLAATPALLIVQMLALPIYLNMFLGETAGGMIQMEPFLHAFVWLILAPLGLAAAVEFVSHRSALVRQWTDWLGLLPVPATALVLFVVGAAVVPQLGTAMGGVASVVPIYIAFAVIAPFVGWACGRIARLETRAVRTTAFSAATRNSLVVLPLTFAVPNAMPLLPAIIVAQTLVELVSELVYIRVMPMIGTDAGIAKT